MNACETCWATASFRAAMLGGFTADRYREVLAEHPNGHDHAALTEATTPGDRVCPSCAGRGGDSSGPCWDCQGGALTEDPS